MRGNLRKHKGKMAASGTSVLISLDFVTTCPKCGGEIGLWSRDIETICLFCNYRIFDKESTTH